MPVAVVIPSRNRPDGIIRAIQDTDSKATCDDTVIVVCLDTDDGTVPQKPDTKHKLIWSIEPREDSLGQKYNRGAALVPEYTALLFCDDLEFSKAGYDQIVNQDAKRFPDGYGIIGYGTQVWANVAQIVALTAKMREWLGYFMPPYFPAWWHETWIEELGYYMGRYLRSNDFEALEVGGRGVSTGLRDVALWGQFFQYTRILREDVAIRFRNERGMSLMDFSALREYFNRRSKSNADPNIGKHFEEQFGKAPISDERHNRLLEQAHRVAREVDRLQRKRDDDVLFGAEYRP